MKIADPIDSFTEFLRRKGLKVTAPRSLVVKEALETQGHFTADALWIKAHKKDSHVSRATVYRTLQLLTESKLVEPRDFEQGRLYYERMAGHSHHDHLICTECGGITEFENQAIETLQEKVAKKYRFEVTSHSHKLYGVCFSCRSGKKQTQNNRMKIRV